jgi:hypothetical protein
MSRCWGRARDRLDPRLRGDDGGGWGGDDGGSAGWCPTLGVTPAEAGVHLSTGSVCELGPGLRRGDRWWVGRDGPLLVG